MSCLNVERDAKEMIQSEIAAIKTLTNSIINEALAIKFAEGDTQPQIEAEYTSSLFDIMELYTDSDQPITSFRNAFRRVMNDAFNTTAETGWTDGGASLPINDDLRSWLNSEIETEIAYIDDVFTELKELRKTGTPDEQTDFIQAKAEGYAGALIGIYDYAKMAAQPERDGEWREGDTIDKCDTCVGLDGQVHLLRWYLENGYIPQQRGSETLECGGWMCLCTIVDPKTGEQLVP
jgi:hypothetical protein